MGGEHVYHSFHKVAEFFLRFAQRIRIGRVHCRELVFPVIRLAGIDDGAAVGDVAVSA